MMFPGSHNNNRSNTPVSAIEGQEQWQWQMANGKWQIGKMANGKWQMAMAMASQPWDLMLNLRSKRCQLTDKDTPHAPKIMLTSIRPSTKGQENTPIKDRYHWPHRP